MDILQTYRKLAKFCLVSLAKSLHSTLHHAVFPLAFAPLLQSLSAQTFKKLVLAKTFSNPRFFLAAGQKSIMKLQRCLHYQLLVLRVLEVLSVFIGLGVLFVIIIIATAHSAVFVPTPGLRAPLIHKRNTSSSSSASASLTLFSWSYLSVSSD
jgi:hypothetical protein